VETLKLVVASEPVPPSRLRPDVPRDLETICLRCLEKDPRRRFPSALALAEDLARFQEGRPIWARPVGRAQRLWRLCLRNPKLASLATILVLTFAVGTPALTGLWLRARTDRARAETQRDRAERARDRALRAVRQFLLRTYSYGGAYSEELLAYRKGLLAEGLQESQGLVQELEGDPATQSQLVEAYTQQARILRDCGEPVKALEYAHKAVSTAEHLLKRDSKSTQYRYFLAFALHQLAYTETDRDAACRAARRSNDVFRSLPQKTRQEMLLVVHSIVDNQRNIGHWRFSQGRLPEAIEELSTARTLYQGVLGDRQVTDRFRYDAGLCELYLGRVLRLSARVNDSLDRLASAIELFKDISGRHPDEMDYDKQLYLAHEELAMAQEALEQWPRAIESFSAAREVIKKMAARHGKITSRMAEVQEALAIVD
jgi:tetratricopeptide (TPR) repeat protein